MGGAKEAARGGVVSRLMHLDHEFVGHVTSLAVIVSVVAVLARIAPGAKREGKEVTES